jgi:hypothetical protein
MIRKELSIAIRAKPKPWSQLMLRFPTPRRSD